MNNPTGIGIRLAPQENSNSFWIKSLKSYNRASLTVISDTTNNWYYLKPFTLILVNKGNIYIIFPISTFLKVQERHERISITSVIIKYS